MRTNFYLKYVSEESFQKFDEEIKSKLLDNEKLIAWLEAKQLEYFNNKCYKDGITCLLCDAMLESKMLIKRGLNDGRI